MLEDEKCYMTYTVYVCFTSNYQYVPFVYYNLMAKMDTLHEGQCVERTFLNIIMREILDRSKTHFM
jgi:hypothetical protein